MNANGDRTSGHRPRGWRKLFLAAAALVVVVVAAILTTNTLTSRPSTTTLASTPTTTTPLVTPPAPPSDRTGPASPTVGVSYPFSLFSHCGIAFTRFADREWQAVTPLPDPPRLANSQGVTHYTGYVAGTMTLFDPNMARFVITDPAVASNGHVIDFRPVATAPPPCA